MLALRFYLIYGGLRMDFGLSWKPLVVMLILSYVFGCGIDNIENNEGSMTDTVQDIQDIQDNENQIPIITIEQRIVKPEEIWREESEVILWRLRANSIPKTDLPVKVNNDWVIIHTSQEYSDEFNFSIFDDIIQIYPLPTISVVGKGLVVDIANLNKNLPNESLGGHIIPKFFDFPPYKVGDPSRIVGDVKFNELDPASLVSAVPEVGDIAVNSSITIIFDNNPGNVTVSTGTVVGSGKTRTIIGPFRVGVLALTIEWSNGEGTETFHYNVVVPVEDPQ